MGENVQRYIDGLKREKVFAKANKDDAKAKAVQVQISKARKQLSKGSTTAEAVVAEEAETPESK